MAFSSFVDLIGTIARNWNPEIEYEIRDCVEASITMASAEYYSELAKMAAFQSSTKEKMSYAPLHNP